ncbi:S8 family serine peptidase [candidate division KSB1 bacterium]|nr:S8 family serine peptidase [candidate division KSB1 bacterium]
MVRRQCRYFVNLIVMLISISAFANIDKMDARLGRLAMNPERVRTESPVLRKSGTTYLVRTIVTLRGSAAELDNVRVIYHYDDMAIVDIALPMLHHISDLDCVVYMEMPTPTKATLDQSTQIIGAVQAREGRGAGGRNVVVGIIDSGIDWRHDDFLKPDGTTRIKYLLDLSEAGAVYGGIVYGEDQINAALAGHGNINAVDISGHGTHVAGIAAGDGVEGYGYGDYAGVAPEADIVAVKATRDRQGSEFYTTDQILALAFIDSVAQVLGKPWVANLSLGGHSGAHDGTSPVERYIDKITGPGIPGKAVVTVAGNDGDRDIHAKTSISSANDSPLISFAIDAFTPNAGPSNDVIELTGWYDGSRKIGVTLISPSGNRYGPVLPSQVFPDGDRSHPSSDGSIYIWNGFYFTDSGEEGQSGANPHNGDREFYISISDDDQAVLPATGEWHIEFSGAGGAIDMWLVNSSMEAYFIQGKVNDGKLTIPGTAKNSITVASFISKKTWQDLDGNRLTFDSQGNFAVGQISPFSSPGPVRKADYQKPDIAAPGQIICSTFSVDSPPTNPYSIFQSDPNLPNALINQDGYHALSSGTSFAAPHVTGAVALILEQNAQLSVNQIRDILQKAADSDGWVGDVPNTLWGWGKVNVFQALLLDPEEEPPTMLSLYPAAPNPFVGRTGITFDVPLLENIPTTRIVIYNALGREVRTLVNEMKNSGSHTVYWDGHDDGGAPVGKGVYFIQMTFGVSKIAKKALFLGIEK